jgi:hypothetical protein
MTFIAHILFRSSTVVGGIFTTVKAYTVYEGRLLEIESWWWCLLYSNTQTLTTVAGKYVQYHAHKSKCENVGCIVLLAGFECHIYHTSGLYKLSSYAQQTVIEESCNLIEREVGYYISPCFHRTLIDAVVGTRGIRITCPTNGTVREGHVEPLETNINCGF